MLIVDVLEKINIISTHGDLNRDILGLTADSREVKKGHMFIAVNGIRSDGHDYIHQAIENGAVAIVCESLPDDLVEGVSYIQVTDSEYETSRVAGNFYKNPSHEMNIIAITGTDGKTTVAHMLYESLLDLDGSASLFSTAGDYINGQKVQLLRKSPSSIEPVEMQKYLRQACNAGSRYVCIEATSHALDQQRYSGIKIARAVFTNLTQDHLDYHKTMDHYINSKKRLFDCLPNDSISVVNMDDVCGVRMVADTDSKIISYGQAIDLDVRLSVVGYDKSGMNYMINDMSFESSYLGLFNAYNLAATYTVLDSFGFTSQDIASTLHRLPGVPGRMQIVSHDQDFLVVVDYAHTDDALRNVLQTLKDIPHNRIITVVGCGGDRDRSKRPRMAATSQTYSDQVYFTADNPRSESLDRIFDDMRGGLGTKQNHEFIYDRRQAISLAIQGAQRGDIVLIAGKGHEDYQEIAGVKKPFDDVLVAESFLRC